MIFLTRLNGKVFYVNPELIETVEATPDTVVTLLNNTKFIVKDSPQQITERYIEYRRKTMVPFTSDKPGE